MKLAVIGSRSLNTPAVRERVNAYLSAQKAAGRLTEIVSGGALGPDTFAAWWAELNDVPVQVIRPNYAAYPGKERWAPLARNREIAAYADAVVAFYDGHSRGTKHCLSAFEALDKPATVLDGDGQEIAA